MLEHQGRGAEARALYDLAEAMDPADARGLASRAAFRKLRLELSKQFVRNRAGVLLEFAQKYPRTELAARAVAAVARIAPAMRPAETRVRDVSQAVVRGLQARKDPLALNAVTWSLLDASPTGAGRRGAQAAAPYELDHVVRRPPPHDTPADQGAAHLGGRVRKHDGVGRARHLDDAPPERDSRGEAAGGVDLGQLRHARALTSRSRAAPPRTPASSWAGSPGGSRGRRTPARAGW